MAWRWLLSWFDPRGRLSRPGYGRILVRLLFLSVAAFCAAIALVGQDWRGVAALFVAAALLLWLASLAQTVRRLHDRNRSGWWLALALTLYCATFAPIEKSADAHPIPVLLFTLGSLVFSIWFVIETLSLRGTDGPNRFGAAVCDGPASDQPVTSPHQTIGIKDEVPGSHRSPS